MRNASLISPIAFAAANEGGNGKNKNKANDDSGQNPGADVSQTETLTEDRPATTASDQNLNRQETPPAKVEPVVGVIIRGDVSAIPEALLNRGQTTYNWADMLVGDHKLVTKAEAPVARASAYAHGRSHGKKFASMAHGADKNYVEIWRLMDPTTETPATQMQQQQQQVNQQNENTDF